MSESSWYSWDTIKAAYLSLLYAHVPYEKDAARIVGKSARSVSDFSKDQEVYFTKPLHAGGPILPPANWFVELIQFLLQARRTGKVIQLPRDLLLRWVREICPEVLRPEYLHPPPPPDPPRPQFPPQPPRA